MQRSSNDAAVVVHQSKNPNTNTATKRLQLMPIRTLDVAGPIHELSTISTQVLNQLFEFGIVLYTTSNYAQFAAKFVDRGNYVLRVLHAIIDEQRAMLF